MYLIQGNNFKILGYEKYRFYFASSSSWYAYNRINKIGEQYEL